MAVAWAVTRTETAICCLARAKLNCDADDLGCGILIPATHFYGLLGETWAAGTYTKVLVVLGRCWRLARAYTGICTHVNCMEDSEGVWSGFIF